MKPDIFGGFQRYLSSGFPGDKKGGNLLKIRLRSTAYLCRTKFYFIMSNTPNDNEQTAGTTITAREPSVINLAINVVLGRNMEPTGESIPLSNGSNAMQFTTTANNSGVGGTDPKNTDDKTGDGDKPGTGDKSEKEQNPGAGDKTEEAQTPGVGTK
ncbi:MAG: hypothetical protein WBA74_19410 [Cyclobacteriaceae bacterium]